MSASAWQRELADVITRPEELIEELRLDSRWLEPARAAAQKFDLRVPRSFVARMRRGDANDPLLRQVMPLAEELVETPGYSSDPLAERVARRAPGLLQKYAGRALLVTTQACAVHCRYCFRREFPYDEQRDEEGGRHAAALRLLQYVRDEAHRFAQHYHHILRRKRIEDEPGD